MERSVADGIIRPLEDAEKDKLVYLSGDQFLASAAQISWQIVNGIQTLIADDSQLPDEIKAVFTELDGMGEAGKPVKQQLLDQLFAEMYPQLMAVFMPMFRRVGYSLFEALMDEELLPLLAELTHTDLAIVQKNLEFSLRNAQLVVDYTKDAITLLTENAQTQGWTFVAEGYKEWLEQAGNDYRAYYQAIRPEGAEFMEWVKDAMPDFENFLKEKGQELLLDDAVFHQEVKQFFLEMLNAKLADMRAEGREDWLDGIINDAVRGDTKPGPEGDSLGR